MKRSAAPGRGNVGAHNAEAERAEEQQEAIVLCLDRESEAQ